MSQSVLWLPLYKTTDHQSINSIMMGLETLQHFQAKKYWMRERDGVRKTVLSKRRVNSIGKKKKETKSCCAAHHNFFFALDRSKIITITTTSYKNWAWNCELWWILWALLKFYDLKCQWQIEKAGTFFLIYWWHFWPQQFSIWTTRCIIFPPNINLRHGRFRKMKCQ